MPKLDAANLQLEQQLLKQQQQQQQILQLQADVADANTKAASAAVAAAADSASAAAAVAALEIDKLNLEVKQLKDQLIAVQAAAAEVWSPQRQLLSSLLNDQPFL
jgi:hypothetical protein